MRESYLRAREGNCHDAASTLAYRSSRRRYGGYEQAAITSPATGATSITADGFRALLDVERLCHDQSDMTGISTTGGVSLYVFFKNMFTGTVTGNVNYAAPGSTEWGVTAAYIHTEHVGMISLSSGGVVKED